MDHHIMNQWFFFPFSDNSFYNFSKLFPNIDSKGLEIINEHKETKKYDFPEH